MEVKAYPEDILPCVRLKGQTDVPGVPPPVQLRWSQMTGFLKDFLGDSYRLPCWLMLWPTSMPSCSCLR